LIARLEIDAFIRLVRRNENHHVNRSPYEMFGEISRGQVAALVSVVDCGPCRLFGEAKWWSSGGLSGHEGRAAFWLIGV